MDFITDGPETNSDGPATHLRELRNGLYPQSMQAVSFAECKQMAHPMKVQLVSFSLKIRSSVKFSILKASQEYPG